MVRPLQQLHLHGRLAHDGADREPVAHGGHAARDHVATVPLDHLAVLGVGLQRIPAAGDEVEHPAPLVVPQVPVGPCGAHLGEQLVGVESAADRDGHGMLGEQVERTLDRTAGLDLSRLQRRAGRGDIHQLERVGGDAGQPAHGTGPVAAPTRALNEPTDALGAPDLQHAVHRREVHAEVERRGAHHAAQLALTESVLDPFAGAPIHRAVVQARGRPPSPGAPRAAPGTRSQRWPGCW